MCTMANTVQDTLCSDIITCLNVRWVSGLLFSESKWGKRTAFACWSRVICSGPQAQGKEKPAICEVNSLELTLSGLLGLCYSCAAFCSLLVGKNSHRAPQMKSLWSQPCSDCLWCWGSQHILIGGTRWLTTRPLLSGKEGLNDWTINELYRHLASCSWKEWSSLFTPLEDMWLIIINCKWEQFKKPWGLEVWRMGDGWHLFGDVTESQQESQLNWQY